MIQIITNGPVKKLLFLLLPLFTIESLLCEETSLTVLPSTCSSFLDSDWLNFPDEDEEDDDWDWIDDFAADEVEQTNNSLPDSDYINFPPLVKPINIIYFDEPDYDYQPDMLEKARIVDEPEQLSPALEVVAKSTQLFSDQLFKVFFLMRLTVIFILQLFYLLEL